MEKDDDLMKQKTSFSGLSGSGFDLFETAGRGRGGAGGGLYCLAFNFFLLLFLVS